MPDFQQWKADLDLVLALCSILHDLANHVHVPAPIDVALHARKGDEGTTVRPVGGAAAATCGASDGGMQ